MSEGKKAPPGVGPAGWRLDRQRIAKLKSSLSSSAVINYGYASRLDGQRSYTTHRLVPCFWILNHTICGEQSDRSHLWSFGLMRITTNHELFGVKMAYGEI